MKKKRNKSVSSLLAIVLLLGFAMASSTVAEEPDSKEEARVDLNSADVEKLMTLPGVGETVAKRIVAYREQNGPFAKTEELMNVRGIGEKTYTKLEPSVTVGRGSKKKK